MNEEAPKVPEEDQIEIAAKREEGKKTRPVEKKSVKGKKKKKR